jgi:tetratricopeptide (TPR) repeat protein
MTQWTAFPHAGDYVWDAASVKESWTRLHQGDCEALPEDAAVLQAWVLFHNGEFQAAAQNGMEAGGKGITVANTATSIYANYLEAKEKTRLELFMEVASRAEAQQALDPENANAWYWQAYALGRYSQGISVAKALAQGLGGKVKQALEQTIKLSPRHADAHIALATFHAEVIDKVGALIAGMTYGAKKDIGLSLYLAGLKLSSGCAIAMMEYANGMVMLEGDKRMPQATELYERAASSQPADAAQRLGVDMARAGLKD